MSRLKNLNYGRLLYRHHMKYTINKTYKCKFSTAKYLCIAIGSVLTAYLLNGYDIGKVTYSMIITKDFSQKAGAIVDILAKAMYCDKDVFSNDNYDMYAPYFHDNRENHNTDGTMVLRVPGSSIGCIRFKNGIITEAIAYWEHNMDIHILSLDKTLRSMIGSKVKFYENKLEN